MCCSLLTICVVPYLQCVAQEVNSLSGIQKMSTMDDTLAELQCIYKTSIQFNGLLPLPLTVLSPASLYDGKLVMYFAMPRTISML